VAGFFAMGHKRSGLAGFKVYKTGRPTDDKASQIQDRRSGGILGKKVGVDKRRSISEASEGRGEEGQRSTYGRQFYDLIWSLALVNASIEHGLKVAGSCPLAR
jgi:hypothetical protein